MAEFTSLNGYQVKDTVARSIAKGRNQAVAFTDYATMIETLNEYEKDEYKAGQNIYIGVVGVPDLWVYSVEDIRHTFIYESDDDIVDKLKNHTTVQVGFFKLAMLEGQKVDLTTYDQKLLEHDDKLEDHDGELKTLTDSLGEDVNGMTVHEKLDEILSEIKIPNNYLEIDGREHGAGGSVYSFTYTLSDVEQYKHLLVLLVGFSNVAGSKTSMSCSTEEYIPLVTYDGTTNNNASASVGLYMIPNPVDNMTISTYSSASGIEKIFGI